MAHEPPAHTWVTVNAELKRLGSAERQTAVAHQASAFMETTGNGA